MMRTYTSLFLSFILCWLTLNPALAQKRVGQIASTVFVTNTNSAGSGSLSAAIDQVNQGNANTIRFDPSLAGSTILFNSTHTVLNSVNIEGLPGDRITITGQGSRRALNFAAGNHNISHLRFENSKHSTGAWNTPALIGGAAISNAGNMTLTDCYFRNNRATGSGGQPTRGGAIYSTGPLTLIRTDFVVNQVFGNGSQGGAIYSTSSVTLIDCNVHSNFIGQPNGSLFDDLKGGAISIEGGSLLMEGASFWNNRILHNDPSHGFGGALALTASPATITNSTFSGNYLNSSGYNTIYCYGGAIYAKDGDLNLSFTTIAGNYAGYTSGFYYNKLGGGLYFDGGLTSSLTLQTTIIADNFATTAPNQPHVDLMVEGGLPTSLGGNVIKGFQANGAGGNTTNWVQTNDKMGVSAQLRALATNGGRTRTRQPGCSSPARNIMPLPSGAPITDQAGNNRVREGLVDAGAYEGAPISPNSGISAPGSAPYNSFITVFATNYNNDYTYTWEATAPTLSYPQNAVGASATFLMPPTGKPFLDISLTVTNEEGCKTEYTEDVRPVNQRSAINDEVDVDTEVPFQLYPNPATDFLQWDGPSVSGSFKILSTDGRVRQTEVIPQANRINISTLPTGVYWLVLEQENGEQRQTQSFVKQ